MVRLEKEGDRRAYQAYNGGWKKGGKKGGRVVVVVVVQERV